MNPSATISATSATYSMPSVQKNKIQYTQEIRGTYQEWENRINQSTIWYDLKQKNAWERTQKVVFKTEELILRFIALQAMDSFYQVFNAVKEQSGIYQEDFSFFKSIFSEIADHYITNASDSLIKCLIEKKATSYEAILNIKLSFENEILRLEVEDNGTGIPFDIEQKIFSAQVTTKEEERTPHYGGVGCGLMSVIQFKENLEGKAGFVNKGDHQGALFWFEASLKNCKQIHQSSSYRRHLQKKFDNDDSFI